MNFIVPNVLSVGGTRGRKRRSIAYFTRFWNMFTEDHYGIINNGFNIMPIFGTLTLRISRESVKGFEGDTQK
jgi:hypothetical protein